MKRLLLLALCMCAASDLVLAGPNAGGTLVVHNTGILFSELGDLPQPPESPPPAGCAAVVNQAPAGDIVHQTVWKVYASFPEGASPRLKGLAWGIAGYGDLYVTGGGLPSGSGGFEIVQGSWPSPAPEGQPESKIGEAFSITQTSLMVECYWFTGFGYPGAGFATVSTDSRYAEFVDDSTPAQEDPIYAFSDLGFGVPGHTRCYGRVGDDSSIWCWGSDQNRLSRVSWPNDGFVGVSAGWDHSLGLRSSGSISGWGQNWSGQCDAPAPNSGFVAVDAGNGYSLGLKSDGSIVAWGRNDYGQCTVPAPNMNFVAVAAGDGHSLGLKSNGSIVGWGRNTWGQCNPPAPNAGFVAIDVGMEHSLGLKADGSIVAWGLNTDGQCAIPFPNSGFVAASAGGLHSLGLKSDGSITAWGDDEFGQCDVPAPNADFVAISAGEVFSLGLKSDGSIVAWTWNHDGQCNVPVPNERFAAIAAGDVHSLGLIGPLTGACCRVEGTCATTAEEDCAPPNTWLGPLRPCVLSPCLPSAVPPEPGQGDAVLRVAPNPSRSTVRLLLPGPGHARIQIFDAAGRMLRAMEETGSAPSIAWDGRDDTGRPVPAGVYQVRLQSEAGDAVRSVVITR